MAWIEGCNEQSVFGNAPRKFRKCRKVLFVTCNTVASPPKNFLAFATPLQVSRKTFWRLQHRCKSHEKLSGVCNTVASLTKNFLAFATLLQVPRKTFWRLQHCCKHFQKRFGYRVAPVETLGGLYLIIGLTRSSNRHRWAEGLKVAAVFDVVVREIHIPIDPEIKLIRCVYFCALGKEKISSDTET